MSAQVHDLRRFRRHLRQLGHGLHQAQDDGRWQKLQENLRAFAEDDEEIDVELVKWGAKTMRRLVKLAQKTERKGLRERE